MDRYFRVRMLLWRSARQTTGLTTLKQFCWPFKKPENCLYVAKHVSSASWVCDRSRLITKEKYPCEFFTWVFPCVWVSLFEKWPTESTFFVCHLPHPRTESRSYWMAHLSQFAFIIMVHGQRALWPDTNIFFFFFPGQAFILNPSILLIAIYVVLTGHIYLFCSRSHICASNRSNTSGWKSHSHKPPTLTPGRVC